MYYNNIMSRQEEVSREISALEQEISSLPAGELLFVSNGKYIKWFQTDGHHPTYIPKKERVLAEKLAYKKYLTTKLQMLRQEQQANTRYLEKHARLQADALHTLLCTPAYRELFSPNFTPLSEELTAWMTEPFQGNPKKPEQLIHQTSSGIYVRSKSESLIAMLLHTSKIPFRYEAPLFLDDFTFYPDFTIRHPRTGEYFYLEHFGLMDDERYRQHALFKINQYTAHGIIPSVNLITTFETKEHPLNIDLVKSYIRHYFL